MMKVAASILFDASYTECALLTAFELLQRSQKFHTIYLLYLTSDEAQDQQAQELVASFCERFQGAVPVHAIAVKNTLNNFQAYHFNNSIIYKALIPSLLPHEPFILNIDAGILLGQRFDAFVDNFINSHCTDDAQWILSAHCIDPAANMPESLAHIPRNSLYPAGAIFFFHTANYLSRNWFERYIHNFNHWQSRLQYAEQELICLTAHDGELRELPFVQDIHVRTLGADVLNGAKEQLSASDADDCVFFKFAGSIKPWKYWVLDPNKAIYIRRRQDLEQHFKLSGHGLIEHHRELAPRPDWVNLYQQAYEFFLARNLKS
jgi:lipopolysaccharide biosynthesis glycosyltransferase